LPVVVTATAQPPCLVAAARSDLPGDAQDASNRAVAAVKLTGDESCVDLRFRAPALRRTGCGGNVLAFYSVTLVNEGPDAAHDVLVDFSQAEPVLPDVVFFGDGCDGTRCSFPMVPGGTRLDLEAGSETFENPVGRTVTITVAASSSDYEYASDDNQRTDPLWIDESPKCDEGLAIGLSGCFIATAAYGSPLEPHVQVLRDFRDRHLRRSAAGRAFIELYYRYSPPVAGVIARHASLRLVTRALLTPIVLAVEFPAQAATAVTLVLLGGFLGGRRILRSRG
ncbi:MAG TPA: CFI-box-CTERM domain-containing protein, partial [Steroidobacteraceae bacterium]|nr:CFI-box-CTERM domain-containing protein [Steroidobacteraceae bacterium]